MPHTQAPPELLEARCIAAGLHSSVLLFLPHVSNHLRRTLELLAEWTDARRIERRHSQNTQRGVDCLFEPTLARIHEWRGRWRCDPRPRATMGEGSGERDAWILSP